MFALDQIKIASPCPADWDAMTGTEQVRFCGQCRKNVYNLSEMTRAEAQEVVERQEGHLCVRFYTRADGTLLTRDCPVGVRAARYRRARKLSYAAAVLLSCGAGLLRGAGAVTPVRKAHRPAAVVKRPMKLLMKKKMAAPVQTLGKPAVPTPRGGEMSSPLAGGVSFMPMMGAPPPPAVPK